MRHGSLFSGIGGFDLAAEWMGWENVFHCEINKFCQKVLKYHWPNAELFEDIKQTDFTKYKGAVDIISGGFPCQPYSAAGKRKGKEDDRHLWPQMLRAIREVQPRWVVGENVSGLLNWNGGMVLDEIKADLETAGFEVFPPFVLPACSVNAPHRRDRVWIVANNKSKRAEKKINEWGESKFNGRSEIRNIYNADGESRDVTNTNHKRLQRGKIDGSIGEIGTERNEQFTRFIPPIWEKFPTQSPICGRDDGISNRMDRIKALGNAVVPQVVYEIFKVINTL